jgi:hypothetical protein
MGERPDTSGMRVHVTRRGGLAGVALRASLDTRQLPPPEAAQAEAALRALPWGRSRAQPAGADRFHYEVVAVEGGHERHVNLGEHEIPPTLRPLLELLQEQGELGPASFRGKDPH